MKKDWAEWATAYFCRMKVLMVSATLLFLVACHNDGKVNGKDTPAMTAAVQQLYAKLSKNPDSVGLRFQLVNALDSAGAYPEALKQVDTLIKKDSLNYALWYRKAGVLENMKDTPGALKSYRYAIRVYPSPDALLGAANLLAEQKNDTALLLSKEVAAFRLGREYTAHCIFINGIYYARKGLKKEALTAFNNCLLNDLNYMEAYMEKGFILYDDQQIAAARTIFQTVITLKNTYADGYYWLAKCAEKMADKTTAISNYQKAITLDPSLQEAGLALKRLGAG